DCSTAPGSNGRGPVTFLCRPCVIQGHAHEKSQNRRRIMNFRKGRLAVIVVALAAMCGSWGCAIHGPRSPQSFSLEQWGQMNAVGLSRVNYEPSLNRKSTTGGKGWGAAKGAGYGLAVGVTPGLAIASIVRGCGGAREIGALVCGTIAAAGLGVAVA